jgi:hypothetical protein
MIARSQRPHRGPDGMDHACTFVSVNTGIRCRVIAVTTVQIGLADATRYNPDDQFLGPRLAEFYCVDDEWT